MRMFRQGFRAAEEEILGLRSGLPKDGQWVWVAGEVAPAVYGQGHTIGWGNGEIDRRPWIDGALWMLVREPIQPSTDHGLPLDVADLRALVARGVVS